MPQLPAAVRDAWEMRTGPAIFATANAEALPNAIYVTCVALYDENTILIADNYFDKTRRNLLAGRKGSVLFMTEDKTTYQIKGEVTRHTSGPLFDHMKTWNPTKHPGHAVAALSVEEVYSGAEKLL